MLPLPSTVGCNDKDGGNMPSFKAGGGGGNSAACNDNGADVAAMLASDSATPTPPL